MKSMEHTVTHPLFHCRFTGLIVLKGFLRLHSERLQLPVTEITRNNFTSSLKLHTLINISTSTTGLLIAVTNPHTHNHPETPLIFPFMRWLNTVCLQLALLPSSGQLNQSIPTFSSTKRSPVY